ncbi:MAG TPA: hypothetical protein VF363_03435 [Candidatus Eisenbacteria bacterium]
MTGARRAVARLLVAATPLALTLAPLPARADGPSAAFAEASPPRAVGAWAPLAHLYGGEIIAGAATAAADPAPALSWREARATDDTGEAGRVGGGKKALLLSFLLPGAGEWSLGAKGRATGFFITEGLIWTHYTWFQVAGHLRRNDYVEQAQLNAGVGVESASDDYWKLVGRYATSSGSGADAYEETLRREARDQFPDDPAAQDAWVAQRLPSGDRAWSWSSPDLQQAYRDTRERSNRAFDRAKYSFAFAILNRIASVIDTQVLHRKLARDARNGIGDEGIRLATDTASDGSGRVFLTRRF